MRERAEAAEVTLADAQNIIAQQAARIELLEERINRLEDAANENNHQ